VVLLPRRSSCARHVCVRAVRTPQCATRFRNDKDFHSCTQQGMPRDGIQALSAH
jgi:hypothetical protein